MPCYLITIHGHGTWLPDHPRGYVRRKVGVLAADIEMGRNYRRNQSHEAVLFDPKIQKILVEGVLHACCFIATRCHGIGRDPSHFHALLSWRYERTGKSVSQAIKTSLTHRLNEKYGSQHWFSKGGNCQRVADRKHFDYLMNVYLPGHRGLVWLEKTGDT